MKSKSPFSSAAGIGRAEPEWAALNRVLGTCGHDRIHAQTYAATVDTGAPLNLPYAVTAGDVDDLSDQEFDVLIVGAGLSGATIAEQCSRELGLRCLVIDKREHLGGNCYDYVTKDGIRASKYGAHLFHTQHERVWDYVQKFSEWVPFDHRVKGRVEDLHGELKLVPIPPTQETVNTLFNSNVHSEEEMQVWYDSERILPGGGKEPANGEEAALARVGPQLYERIFRHYTKKQWDKYPEDLDASVLMRLPCRTTTDDRYFNDPWQALPKRGYTRIFENMLMNDDNITIRLNCDFFKLKADAKIPKHKLLIYTGQIDLYYAALGMPKLEYRSLRFEEEYINTDAGYGFFQETMVVNYPSADVPFTRIVEYKHTPNQPLGRQDEPGTLIAREFSTAEGEPYYPVPNSENRELYEKYAAMAANENSVCFVGRLASYKYFNMDQAILNALEAFDNLKNHGRFDPNRRLESAHR